MKDKPDIKIVSVGRREGGTTVLWLQIGKSASLRELELEETQTIELLRDLASILAGSRGIR